MAEHKGISIIDYTKIGPSGRAAGKRVTTYPVRDQEAAYKLHQEAIEAGTLSKPVKLAGWVRSY